MSKLDQIRKYSELLSKASKWHSTNEQILEIESIKNSDQKKEYIYEFYCFLRVICDLQVNYDIEIKNRKIGDPIVFPKGPASKKNFPYFVAKDKSTGRIVFEVCTSIDIIGLAGETSAPDISFHLPKNDEDYQPTHDDVFMLFDAKFKHSLGTNVHEAEFNKVAAMVVNLNTQDAESKKYVNFDKLCDLLGNCLLTNSKAFKDNNSHHKIFSIKEIEYFDIDKQYKVVG